MTTAPTGTNNTRTRCDAKQSTSETRSSMDQVLARMPHDMRGVSDHACVQQSTTTGCERGTWLAGVRVDVRMHGGEQHTGWHALDQNHMCHIGGDCHSSTSMLMNTNHYYSPTNNIRGVCEPGSHRVDHV